MLAPRQTLTVVMYHYVRTTAHTRYKRIRGISTQDFEKQLRYFRRYYQIVTPEEVIAAREDPDILPSNSLMLTFDDGYADHFVNVFPLLDAYGMSGVFFVPTMSGHERQILEVNKIQFVLAVEAEPQKILQSIDRILAKMRTQDPLLGSVDQYCSVCSETHRYDDQNTIYVKYLLQKAIPQPARSQVIDQLFRAHVTEDERAFVEELYLTTPQIRTMQRCGMTFGGHGASHEWLDQMDPVAQRKEIRQTKSFLSELGVPVHNWLMCYPYGGYNQSLLEILDEEGCGLGFSVDVGINDLDEQDLYTLKRLDTNDFPRDANAVPNDWTLSCMPMVPRRPGYRVGADKSRRDGRDAPLT